MMLGQWRNLLVMSSLLSGLYLPAYANTTAQPVAVPAVPVEQAVPPSGVEIGAVDLSSTQRTTSMALLLPLRSATLGEASAAVQAGFRAAAEREVGGITVNLVETGDAPDEILAGYQAAAATNDIVVGPLSRTGVAAVAQSNAVSRPTIALTSLEAGEGSTTPLPNQLLLMGLSVEDEAQQVAKWAVRQGKPGRALLLSTRTAWQKRAAKAFEKQWTQHGREVESVEITAYDGFLQGRDLLDLKKRLEGDLPAILFLALDARQARQVRAVMGKDLPVYGTSQLNPVALTDRESTERMNDLNGARLVDIPWQLQADHPAVMAYPRLVVAADQRRSADIERLYALGIDAFRVAQEIAAGRSRFDIDGVTGKLAVRLEREGSRFDRVEQQAVYREGVAVAIDTAH